MARRPKRDLLRPSPETLESRRLMTLSSVSVTVTPGFLPHNSTIPGGASATFTIGQTAATNGSPNATYVTLRYTGSAIRGTDYDFRSSGVSIYPDPAPATSGEIVLSPTTQSVAIGVDSDAYPAPSRGSVQLNLRVIAPDGHSPQGTPSYVPAGSAATVVIADTTINNPGGFDPESTGVDPGGDQGGFLPSPVTGNATLPGPAAPASPGLPRGGPDGPPPILQVYDPLADGVVEDGGGDGGYGGGDSDVAPATVYGSDNARPIVTTDLYIPQELSSNELIATLTLGGNAVGVPSVTSTTYYANPANATGGVFRFALQVDASSLPTNTYYASIVVSAATVGSGTPTLVATASGRFEVNNRLGSDYGMDQGLSNEETLTVAPDTGGGLSWVRPDGSYTYFMPTGSNTFTAAAGSYATIAAIANGYAITETDGVVYKFTSSPVGYRLTEKDDSDGDADLYSYNAAGDILIYKDAFGRTSTYTYAQPPGTGPTQQMLSTVTDFAGRVATYLYTPFAGRWAVSSVAVGNPSQTNTTLTTTYGYSTTGMTVTDPAGEVTSLLYDAAGRVGQVAILDSADTVNPSTGLPYPSNYAVYDVTTTRPSDEQGLDLNTAPTSLGTLGAAPPASGLLPAVVTRSTQIVGAPTVTPPAAETTTSLVSPLGVVVQVTDPLGLVTATLIDDVGQPTLVQELDANSVDLLRATAYAYYSSSSGASSVGLPATVTYNDGSTESWGLYNAFGEPTSYTDADGNTTAYTYYPNSSELMASSAPLGLTTTYTYDPLGRVLTVKTPGPGTATTDHNNNGTAAVTTTYAYYPAGMYDQMLESALTPDGDLTTYTYYADDSLAHTIDSPGRSATYTYDPFGRLLNFAESQGAAIRVVTFAYDNDGRVTATKVPSPLNQAVVAVTTYVYDSQGRPWVVIEPPAAGGSGAGPTTTFGYDGYDDLVSVVAPNQAMTLNTYDLDGELTAAVDNAGGILNAPSETTAYAYDALGRLGTVTDPMLRVTGYTYDAKDRVTSATQFSAPNVGQTTSYLYDGDGNLVLETDPQSNAVAQANPGTTPYSTTYLYNALGELIQVSRPPGLAGGLAEVTAYTYDPLGDVLTAEDPLLNTTTYQYDTMGRRTEVIQPAPSTSGPASTIRTTTTTYSQYGEVEAVTVPRDYATTVGYTTTYTYDAFGDLVQVAQPPVAVPGSSSLASPTTSYNYDEDGDLRTVTDPDSYVTTYTYDALGELASVLQNPVVANGPAETTSYLYDPDGNLSQVTDPAGYRTTYAYDGLDRLTGETRLGATASANLVTTYTYNLDNELRTVADPDAVAAGSGGTAAYVTTYSYDFAGRLTQTQAPVAASGPVTTATTILAYDADGDVTAVEDPDGNTTAYAYDQLDRVKTATDPAGDVTAYTYDVDDQLKTKVVGTSTTVTTTYTYDALGRLLSESAPAPGYSSQSAVTETLSFGYDPEGRLNSATDANVIANVPVVSTQAYTYDAAGRLASSSQAVTNSGNPMVATFTLSYAYDQDGRLVGSADSSGGTTGYSRDALGRLLGVSASQGSHANAANASFAYNADGQVTLESRTVGTGTYVSTSYTYDPYFGRLSSQSDFSSQTHQLIATTYAYDADGHVTGRTTTFSYNGSVTGSEALAYGYDRSGELTSASGHDLVGTVSATYAYDAAGNRQVAGAPAPSNGRVVDDGTYTYAYDSAGDMTRQTLKANTAYYTAYTYDSFGRISSVVAVNASGTTSETYAYDATGDRVVVLSSVSGGTYATEYDGANPYADLTPTTGTMPYAESTRYLSGDAVDAVLGKINLANLTYADWYLRDAEGSVRELVADNGGIVDQITYDAFGTVRPGGESNPSGGDRFKYAGGQSSAVSGLEHFGARDLQASLGRWTESDPIGFAGGDANLYRYVGDDPTDEVDPSGLIFGQESLYNYYAGLFGNSTSSRSEVDRGQDLDAQVRAVQAQHQRIGSFYGNSVPTQQLGDSDVRDQARYGGIDAKASTQAALNGIVQGGRDVGGELVQKVIDHGAGKVIDKGLDVAGKVAGRYKDKIDDLVSAAKPSQSDLGNLPVKPVAAVSRAQRLADIAANLGYRRTNYRSSGQPVFYNGKMYITPDITVHNGGVFKAADTVANLGSKQRRLGTYDGSLNRIGD